MSEIIEGLPVDVPAAEVIELAVARAQHHEARAAFYQKQAHSLAEGERDEGHSLRAHTSLDALSDLRSKASDHLNKAKHLRFLSQHLESNAVYRLGHDELHTLGVTRSRYA